MTSSATRLSSLKAYLGHGSPLFPSLEAEMVEPSEQHGLKRCYRIWKQTKAALQDTITA